MDTLFHILKETNCNEIMQGCNVWLLFFVFFFYPHVTSAVDGTSINVENNSCATEMRATLNGGIFMGHLSLHRVLL